MLASMRAAFDRAMESGLERVEYTVVVDAVAVRLVFAGRDMEEAVMPALSPVLASTTEPPALTIELWDSASSGVAPPAEAWANAQPGALGALRGYNDGLRRAVVDAASKTVVTADLGRRRAVVWTPSARELPRWWRAVALRVPLSWALADPHRHLAHAGAVGMDGRGVLLGGGAGAGKSTLAVACAHAGMSFVADDYLLLTATPRPRAHCVFGTAKLDAHSLEIVGDFDGGDAVALPVEDKVVIDLHARRPDLVVGSLSVDAVVLPRLAPVQDAQLRPLSAADALRRLAPSTIFQAPDGGGSALAVLAAVLRRVEAYELTLGADVSQGPRAIAELLATTHAFAGMPGGSRIG